MTDVEINTATMAVLFVLLYGVFRYNIFGPRALTGLFMKPRNERQSR
jgi:hypothetical protein